MLRCWPHPLREDFVTVGLLVLERDGAFAEVRFTRHWKTLHRSGCGVEVVREGVRRCGREKAQQTVASPSVQGKVNDSSQTECALITDNLARVG